MTFPARGEQYLTAHTEAGLLIIHSTPLTLSWVPHDVVNHAFNVGGIVTVGTFDTVEEAKHAAKEQYSVRAEDWQVSDALPFEIGRDAGTETHTPDVEGHKLIRHGIHWKRK
ncbi:MAG: hypothetical protein ACJ746_13805 [Bryobacteraceae bacterium]